MDKKRLISAIIVSLVIFGAWLGVNYVLQKTHPEWYRPEEPTTRIVATQPTTAPTSQAAVPTTGPAVPSPTIAPTQPTTVATTGMRAVGLTSPKPASVGQLTFAPDKNSTYPVGLVIEPRGAGLSAAILNRFRESIGKNQPYTFQTPDEKAPADRAVAFATRSIQVDGGPWIDVSDIDWRQDSISKDTASYSIDVVAGPANSPDRLLTITKTYTLSEASKPSEGYEVSLKYSVVNHTSQPHKVKFSFNGPNVPKIENTRDVPEVVIGYNDENHVRFGHHTGSTFKPDASPTSLIDPKQGPLMWTGITSAYFDSIVLGPADGGFSDVNVKSVAQPSEEGQEYLSLTFVAKEMDVPAAKSASLPLEVYLGPRKREILNTAYYASFPRGYDQTLVITSWICGFCTWGWLINALVWLLQAFHFVLRDWGLAIIVLVVLVRLALHPITKRSQISMQKMTKLGPEIERLKKKYGDNKEELNRATMALYKEQGFTPILGCLPMFLQMPIWIALWTALQGTFELRHSSFLWGWTWIKDLAQPDRLIAFHHYYKVWFFGFDAINLLPILMGVVFFLQQYMSPRSATETPEQAQQRKMMYFMTLLFPLILYNGPAGLNLYILASTAIGIWESKRVRDHIKAQEEAEKAGKVIVDAKPTRASKRAREQAQQQEKQAGCLGGWMAQLQQKAEQMRNEAERRKPKR